MTNKSNIKWQKIVAESTGIIFAVLLALWLEGWREDIELQEKADASLIRVHLEIEENRKNMQEAIADNRANIDGITAAIEKKDFSIDALGQYLQVSAGSASDAAWTSAKMTQAMVRMPPEIVEDLTALYETQSYYTAYVQFFFEQYTDLTAGMQQEGDDGWSARKFLQHLQITNSFAAQAIEQYDDFLAPGSEPASTSDTN